MSPYWSNSYTEITFNGNGGTGSMEKQLIDRYAGGMPIFKNKFVRDGYEFIGWNTAQDGSGEMYDIDGYYYPEDVYGKSEVILYAQWAKVSAE